MSAQKRSVRKLSRVLNRRSTSSTRSTTRRRSVQSGITSTFCSYHLIVHSMLTGVYDRAEEQEYLSSLTDSLSSGTTWSRIADLIELQNSQSKTLARAGPGTTDLTRFKEVLVRLRREGESAPGAAGY